MSCQFPSGGPSHFPIARKLGRMGLLSTLENQPVNHLMKPSQSLHFSSASSHPGGGGSHYYSRRLEKSYNASKCALKFWPSALNAFNAFENFLRTSKKLKCKTSAKKRVIPGKNDFRHRWGTKKMCFPPTLFLILDHAQNQKRWFDAWAALGLHKVAGIPVQPWVGGAPIHPLQRGWPGAHIWDSWGINSYEIKNHTHLRGKAGRSHFKSF